MMTFEQLNLNDRIYKAIAMCGYTNPTSIQAKSIPHILEGKDIVASAQTGTGKTASFVLPALNKIISSPSKGKPRVLILTPTRELATQITDAVSKYGKFTQPSIVSLLGGMPYHKQLRALSRKLDIIIATPGRLLDHLERGRVDLSSIEMLILDEADRMLDMGFIDDVTMIASKTPKSRQTLLFSATVDNKLATVVRNLLNDPIRVEIAEKLTPNKIKQELYHADNPHHKMRLLMHLLANENMYKAIIFSATKLNADRLAKELCDNDYPALPLHGDLKQNARNKTVEQLRRGKVQFVVATDVASRGIDISDITHVINFDLPRFSEDYVHRIGRTGRAGKTGIAISLALPSDYRHLNNIERYIGQKFSPSIIEGLEPTKRSDNSYKRGGDKSRGFKSDSRDGFKKRSGGFKSEGGYKRDGDKPRSFKKPEGRFERDGDKPRSFKKPEGRFERDSDKPRSFKKPEGRFERDSDKPRSFKKPEGRFERDGDKPRSFKKSEGRFERDGDKPRSFKKPEGRFERDGDKSRSFKKPEGRFKRDNDKPHSFKSESQREGGEFKRANDKPRSFKLTGRDADKPRRFNDPKIAGFKSKRKSGSREKYAN